ncbi:hypothetical protein KAW38_02745 [Candidatus Micrarchaeota archaeon]|nr:hypothetical protein [Candidatus Micrarchaeota archaeon]
MVVRKNALVGIESEFFTVNKEGELLNKADRILDLLKNTKVAGFIQEEIGHSMLEINSKPEKNISMLAVNYLKQLRSVIETARKEEIFLLPLGCYPAKSKPKIRKRSWYSNQTAVFGKENIHYVSKICGLHFHYTLPKGIVGRESRGIKSLRKSYAKDIFLNQYNFVIAADPACTTFAQSSPFVDGKYIAKDSRTLIYRDMSIKNGIHGLYSTHPILGGLPNYEFTLEDLRHLASKRKNLYLDILHERGISVKDTILYPELKFMWGPLRINKIGTLEYRGLDMNLPSYIFALTALLRSALRGIMELNLQVLPSDIGEKEPFKIEDQIVYLPPFSIVKSTEFLSTVYGFENSSVYSYCEALLRFVSKISEKEETEQFSFIKDMLKKKKTLSDEILGLVKKNGYSPDDVPDEFLQYIAIYYARLLEKDIDKTIEFFESKQ